MRTLLAIAFACAALPALAARERRRGGEAEDRTDAVRRREGRQQGRHHSGLGPVATRRRSPATSPAARGGDPFKDDKPLFSITAKNVEQYADKLADGTKAMFKKYPDYRIDVYPTRRSAAAPQWVYDNTLKNATRAKLNGDVVEGAYGGIPFPIPEGGRRGDVEPRAALARAVAEFRASRNTRSRPTASR